MISNKSKTLLVHFLPFNSTQVLRFLIHVNTANFNNVVLYYNIRQAGNKLPGFVCV